jgi:hypothetical protein
MGSVADASVGFWQVSEFPVVEHGVDDEELLVADLRACEMRETGSSPLPSRWTTFRMSKRWRGSISRGCGRFIAVSKVTNAVHRDMKADRGSVVIAVVECSRLRVSMRFERAE